LYVSAWHTVRALLKIINFGVEFYPGGNISQIAGRSVAEDVLEVSFCGGGDYTFVRMVFNIESRANTAVKMRGLTKV
jgi:hypothetical protein